MMQLVIMIAGPGARAAVRDLPGSGPARLDRRPEPPDSHYGRPTTWQKPKSSPWAQSLEAKACWPSRQSTGTRQTVGRRRLGGRARRRRGAAFVIDGRLFRLRTGQAPTGVAAEAAMQASGAGQPRCERSKRQK
jgi:hypothetical protein